MTHITITPGPGSQKQKGGLGWLENLVRIEDRSLVKVLFMGNPSGKRRYGRPRKKCLDNAKNDLYTCGDQEIETEIFHEEWAVFVKRG